MRSMAGAGYEDLGAGYGDLPAAYGQTVGGYGGHTSGGYGEWDGGGYAAVGSEYGTASSYPQTHAQFAGQASYGQTVSHMPQMQQMYPGGALTQGQPLSRDQLDQFQQFQQQARVSGLTKSNAVYGPCLTGDYFGHSLKGSALRTAQTRCLPVTLVTVCPYPDQHSKTRD